MNSKEKIKADLEEQLNYIQGLKFEHSTKKIELASDGSGEVVAIELERTVPLTSYNLSIIEHHFKQDLDWDYTETSLKFLLAYLVKAKSLNFIDYIFEELMEEFQLYLEGKYVYRTISLIYNLDIQNQEIQFSNFSIKPVDKENIEYFYNKVEMTNSHFKSSFRHALFHHESSPCVLLERKQVLCNVDESNSLVREIENLSKSLLLYNGTLEHIYFSPIITFSYFADYGEIQAIQYFNAVDNKKRSGKMTIKDIQLISAYFKIIDELPTQLIALERLASAHNKVNLDDKFIDLIIALESLYPSVRGELLFRVSLYTARLLDGSPDTYKKVKKLYGIRSNLVHGNSNLPPDTLAKELQTLDGIVRQCIFKSLEYTSRGDKLEIMEEDIVNKLLPN